MASEPSPVAGTWRPPGHGKGLASRLSIASGAASVVEDGSGTVLATAPLAAIAISDRVGAIPRHVTFPDGSDFETADNDGIDRLQAGLGHGGLVHGLEQFRPRLLVFVAATIVLCLAIYRYAVPALVEIAIAVTPPVVTQLMSKSVMISLDTTVFEKTGLAADRQKVFSDAFAGIARLTPRGSGAATADKPAYTLNFRKGGPIGANAFALPDGTLVLTDELVELAADDEMVLSVLAHEIGHVDHEHSLRQLYRAAGVAALIMMIGGDIGSGTEDVLVQGSALLSLAYSREAEAQADRYSVELMHKAGHDPASIARFFELIRDKLGDRSESDFLSTHPATPERIAETRRYAAEIAGAP